MREKLTVVKLIKMSVCYVTRKFITAFTRASQWTLSWARRIHSTWQYPISSISILILSLHLLPHSSNGPFPSGVILTYLLTYLLTYSLTHSMVQDIIWKADCHAARQKISRFFTEPEGSSPCSHVPATGPYPEPAESSSPHRFLSKVHFNVILTPTPRSSQWSLAFGPPNQTPVNTSPLTHACHMSSPPHPRFNHLNNIRRRIQIMKIIIIQFSPWSLQVLYVK
jgi:hypothetical protein